MLSSLPLRPRAVPSFTSGSTSQGHVNVCNTQGNVALQHGLDYRGVHGLVA